MLARFAFNSQRLGAQTGEQVARDGDARGAIQNHTRRFLVVGGSLELIVADIAVGEVVARDGDAPTVRP